NAPGNPGPNCAGVVSVLRPPSPAPAGCPVDLAAAHTQLVEAIVEADEALMEKYFADGDVAADELLAALPRALSAGTVVPIFCASARKGVGISELLDAFVEDALSPTQGKQRTAHKKNGADTVEVELKPDPAGETVGQVFKTVSDKFVGTLSFIRLY